MNQPLQTEPSTENSTRSPFFRALRAGPDALADPDRLLTLISFIHADALVCTTMPSASSTQLLKSNKISIFASPIHPSIHPSLHPSRFSTREQWAVAMLHVFEEALAKGWPRVCLADAETLLEDASGHLRWHVACCYRPVQAAVDEVPVPAWDPHIVIPVDCAPCPVPLSAMEIQWELLDGSKVVSRGTAQGSDSASEVSLHLRGAVHPDNWKEEPRIRLHFHRPPLTISGPTTATTSPGGDVLVLRRPTPVVPLPGGEQPPSPIQLSGVGSEISRLEVGLRLELAVECSLDPRPRIALWPRSTRMDVRLDNRIPSSQEVELRLTLHPEQGSAQSVFTETITIAPKDTATRTIRLPESTLGRGANYLLAGFRYAGGVGLKTCLIYRSEASGPLTYYRNTDRSRASFWDSLGGIGENMLPRRITLEGDEDRVYSSEEYAPDPTPNGNESLTSIWKSIRLQYGTNVVEPTSPGDWKSVEHGVRRSTTVWQGLTSVPFGLWESRLEGNLNPDGLLEVRWEWKPEARAVNPQPALQLSFPDEWQQVKWNRQPLWDVYPPNHPDRPSGAAQLPIELSQVRRAVVHGPGGGLVLLAGSRNFDIAVSPGQLCISPSSREGKRGGTSCTFALIFVNDITEAEGLSWKRPASVLKSRHSTKRLNAER